MRGSWRAAAENEKAALQGGLFDLGTWVSVEVNCNSPGHMKDRAGRSVGDANKAGEPVTKTQRRKYAPSQGRFGYARRAKK